MVDKSGFSQRPSIYGVGRVRLTWIAGGLLDSNWIMRGGQKSIELCCHWESMQCRRSGWVILGSTVLLAINIPHYQLTIGGKKGGWQARRQTLYSPAGEKKVCDTGTPSAPPPTPPRDSCSFSLTEFNSLLETITVVIIVIPCLKNGEKSLTVSAILAHSCEICASSKPHLLPSIRLIIDFTIQKCLDCLTSNSKHFLYLSAWTATKSDYKHLRWHI